MDSLGFCRGKGGGGLNSFLHGEDCKKRKRKRVGEVGQRN